MPNCDSPAGGAFLLEDLAVSSDSAPAIFTPEQFPADARLMANAVEDFVRKEVMPANERMEAHEPDLLRGLLRQAGDLGILGIGAPIKYGGLDLPKSQIALLNEKAALHPSFAISAGVHSGVATLPLLFFGTPEQQAKYLPRLASGQWIGAFALTEANSGSDALSAQAKAVLSSDGTHYVLSGSKMWVTNGAFADLLTVFATIEGRGFSAFLVERAFPGVNPSREENKLGLRGSSTTRIVLDGVRVPAENVLGAIGEGRRPALYALNLGRLAIAATALGMCKESLRVATSYALQRVQFGKPIADFGLIRQKLADIAIRTFVLESMLYRTAGYLDARFAAIPADAADAEQRYHSAAEEYAIECAILKVFGTEALGYAVDEALQIHGGYGFSEEFAVAQAYRDARVFRIFEGTNEINRITILDQILRRDRAGRLPLGSNASRGPGPDDPRSICRSSGEAGSAQGAVERDQQSVRASFLIALDLARSQYGDSLIEQQEAAALLADMAGRAYAIQSVWLRTRQSTNRSHSLMLAAAQVAGYDARVQCGVDLNTVLGTVVSNPPGPGWSDLMPPVRNTIALRREVAAAVIDRGGYPW